MGESKKNKNVCSVVWAKDFVEERAHLGSTYDAKHTVFIARFVARFFLNQPMLGPFLCEIE